MVSVGICVDVGYSVGVLVLASVGAGVSDITIVLAAASVVICATSVLGAISVCKLYPVGKDVVSGGPG